MESKIGDNDVHLVDSPNHWQNFIDAVKSRQQPVEHPGRRRPLRRAQPSVRHRRAVEAEGHLGSEEGTDRRRRRGLGQDAPRHASPLDAVNKNSAPRSVVPIMRCRPFAISWATVFLAAVSLADRRDPRPLVQSRILGYRPDASDRRRGRSSGQADPSEVAEDRADGHLAGRHRPTPATAAGLQRRRRKRFGATFGVPPSGRHTACACYVAKSSQNPQTPSSANGIPLSILASVRTIWEELSGRPKDLPIGTLRRAGTRGRFFADHLRPGLFSAALGATGGMLLVTVEYLAPTP